MYRAICKKIILSLICLLILTIPSFISNIQASSELATCNIMIKGKENQKYKAGLAIKYEEGYEKEEIETKNAITNYKDEQGFEFIGMYSEFTTIDTLFYEYVFEKNFNFKVLILTESNILLVTKELTCKEFNTNCIINIENINITIDTLTFDVVTSDIKGEAGITISVTDGNDMCTAKKYLIKTYNEKKKIEEERGKKND